MSKPVVIFFGPVQQVSLPYDLKEAQFTTGSQLNDIFQIDGFLDAGSRRTATIDNIRKEGISAHPPTYGQTILQFPLFVVQEPSTFSFSTGLVKGCSNGVLFQVLLNGQVHSEIFKDTFDWTNGSISLSQFAGQPLLLELITDPAEESGAICDWAYWADLHITAAPNPDANLDGRINILDLITVAQSLGQQPPSNPQADTNKDGVVNLLDLVFVAEHLSQNAAAPSQLALIKSDPVLRQRGYRGTTCFDRVRSYSQQITRRSNRHRTAPTLPIHRRPERQRDQTPAQLPQPLQPRYMDTVSAIGRVNGHCQNLRCDRQLGQNHRSRTQAGRILPHPRACGLLGRA